MSWFFLGYDQEEENHKNKTNNGTHKKKTNGNNEFKTSRIMGIITVMIIMRIVRTSEAEKGEQIYTNNDNHTSGAIMPHCGNCQQCVLVKDALKNLADIFYLHGFLKKGTS